MSLMFLCQKGPILIYVEVAIRTTYLCSCVKKDVSRSQYEVLND